MEEAPSTSSEERELHPEISGKSGLESAPSTAELAGALQNLLHALDFCAGPACPKCGPARQDARRLIDSLNPNSASTEQDLPEMHLIGLVTGRPHSTRTPEGAPVIRFVLQVPDHRGQLSWHRVAAYRSQIEQLRSALRSGRDISVDGVVRERPSRATHRAPVTELEATSITSIIRRDEG